MKKIRFMAVMLQISLLAFCILIFQVGFILQITLLKPQFYQSIMERYHVYEQGEKLASDMILKNFDDTEHSMPYIKKAFSGNWFKRQVDTFVKNVLLFLKGEKGNMPVISGKDIKSRLVTIISKDGIEDAEKLADYWLPIPDRVKFSDIASTRNLWQIRDFFTFLRWLPYGAIALIGLFIIILLLTSSNVKEGPLWLTSSFIGGGELGILLGILLIFFLRASTYLQSIIDVIRMLEFDNLHASLLFWGTIYKILLPLFLFGGIISIAGIFLWIFYKDETISKIKK